MDWLEMHNMEFGECIVLGGKRGDILMVDCGSMNLKLRDSGEMVTDYVDRILVPRYRQAKERHFLLTHYHRDHMSGLRHLLKKDRAFFSRIYLPAAPVDEKGRAWLLEFALYVFVFLGGQSEYAQMSVSALRIFERLRRIVGLDAVYTVGRGDTFSFDSVEYEVLWPVLRDYPFSSILKDAVDEMDVCLSSPFLGRGAPDFLDCKQKFCEAYVRCCALSASPVRALADQRERAVDLLEQLMNRMEELAESLRLLPAAQDVLEILSRPAVRQEYANAQNMASVVFQNVRKSEASYDDILMTGDATPETFDEISEDLYEAYYILKAPHHGTASSWSQRLGDLLASHILISNGDYHAGGMVSGEYARMEGIKHCVNAESCSYYAETGSCCNRIAYCWEVQADPVLALHCPANGGKSRKNGCGIYILSKHHGEGCLCDRNFGEVNK